MDKDFSFGDGKVEGLKRNCPLFHGCCCCCRCLLGPLSVSVPLLPSHGACNGR